MPEPSPVNPATPESDELTRTVSVVRVGLRGLYRSQLPRMAAALAYRTIFSVIPVLAIVLVIASSFVEPEQVRQSFTRMLEYAGFERISVAADDAAPADLVTVEPEDALIEAGAEPEASREAIGVQAIDELITGLVDRVTSSLGSINRGWIGFISAGVFIYAALSLFLEMERSFNQIYRAARGRRWLNRLLLYWTMLTLGSILLMATFSVGHRFTEWIGALFGGESAGDFSLVLAGYGVTVLISTLLLLIMYTAVPNARVEFRTALVGAFMGAIVWELGKWGFTRYVEFSTGYARFYGSLALLPLFLLWVYVTWLIVLFGLQISYALQHFSELKEPAAPDEEPPSLLDPAAILNVAIFVARRFNDAKAPTLSEVARETALDPRQARELCEALVTGGVLHRLTEQGADRYALAAPPFVIRAADVLTQGVHLTGAP
ncbi:MAG: YihY/virulence factor BrkB family protein, partial [Phycisphaerales bacterium JB059]